MKFSKSLKTMAALSSFVAGAALLSTNAMAEKDGAKNFEKCSGIVKAGQNDCKANAHSCAGQSKVDGAAGEWLNVPTGTCDKIVGGMVVSMKKDMKDHMKEGMKDHM